MLVKIRKVWKREEKDREAVVMVGSFLFSVFPFKILSFPFFFLFFCFGMKTGKKRMLGGIKGVVKCMVV